MKTKFITNTDPIKRIDSFTGKYFFLSNFYEALILDELFASPYTLSWKSESYSAVTTEHLYQAAKCVNFVDRINILSAKTPADAKKLGQKVELIPNWDSVKIEVMERCLESKFAPNRPEAKWLLDTGYADLVEGNTWGDMTWGVNLKLPGFPGRNLLGTLLMQQRARLRMN